LFPPVQKVLQQYFEAAVRFAAFTLPHVFDFLSDVLDVRLIETPRPQ
jgi:hypothetical protein